MNKNKIKLFPSLWAIHEPELTKLEAIYQGFTNDMIAELEKDSKLVIDALSVSQTGLSENVTIINNIGVLRIEGVIIQKSDFFTMFFGGAALDTLTIDFKMLVNNEQIDTIVLHIDSPGGTVSGVQEFANLIFEAREQKKIFTISSSIMASGAMWIGAAAEHVLISDNTVTVGSIGVLVTHMDFSKFEEQIGVKVTEVTAGKFKRIASFHAPLSNEGRSELQSQVDHIMNVFTSDIAKFRNVSQQEVELNMADGKIFIGDNAVKAGLVDKIITFDLLIETISNGGIDMGLFSKKEANLQNLKDDHTALFEEAVAVGADQDKKVHAENVISAKADGHKEGLEAGAEAERARIQGIDKVTIKGQEKLATDLKADGKTTPGEAAIKMINANKEANADGLDKIKTTSAKPVESETEDGETIHAKKDSKDMTVKEKWDADPKLAKEFDSFEAFEAVEKNSDNYRILKT